ncbi:DNA-3-methyladenine glycosylase 2 family protein [Paracoccaceae bacterium]|jgi:DNA-3-methyladenine glycosylase II|nr:DNA-3-methyladenine glycosylase 2 family protein [Paracoccaceae bacterium]RCL80727.1 MAG: DNA-3-methyladenine glycosylase 2 family protein [Paracoccaceae bacterium]RPF93447.1 MAG: DNA-3-methyladenine glycosylase 2 family protein [Rhodobacteraceae bacterium TMED160]|tara:strand:- start:4918 stop:5547 length:630 start_codon:yes stop_codon:yes gene_type:complete
MEERIITSQECISEGLVALNKLEPKFRQAINAIDEIPLRRTSGGFDRLLSTIVSQQLSVAAADAIWKKIELAGLNQINKIKKVSDQDLRQVGLSKQKVRYVRSLANAKINYDALKAMPTSEVVSELTQVSGVGNWTAEIYAMFSLGRADVFAPGDLALQEATRLLFNLPERPSEKELRVMAKEWSPWQAVAARLLWSYYNDQKKREGIR